MNIEMYKYYQVNTPMGVRTVYTDTTSNGSPYGIYSPDNYTENIPSGIGIEVAPFYIRESTKEECELHKKWYDTVVPTNGDKLI